jgi:O-phosphoseryl-tRNA(Sec) kinase
MFLIILTGIPCSGKTQLATFLAKKLEINYSFPTVVVDPDNIREMIPALKERFNPERESLVEHLSQVLIEESLKKRNIVISDDMNYYESARHRLVQIAKKYKAKYIIVYLTVSVETAKARNASKASSIPEELISKIAQNFDPPGVKYKWDRPSFVINTEKTGSEEAGNDILELVLSKVKDRSGEIVRTIGGNRASRDSKTTPISYFRHVLDESTRAILNELFSTGKLDRQLSERASRMRRAFVNEASMNSMTIKDAESEFRRRVDELSAKDKQ